jgi:hypothetical protein
MCTAVRAAEHAVSTAMADAPKPKVYANRPAATLSAEPVAAYGLTPPSSWLSPPPDV